MRQGKKCSEVIADAAERCIECGACAGIQDEGCGCPIGTWGSFAARFASEAERDEFEPETMRLLFTCAACGACTVGCPMGIDGPTVLRAGRSVFLKLHPRAADQWRPMHVDRRGNALASVREWRGIHFDDALTIPAARCESLFFPGCTMTAYAPELVHATTDYLRQAGEIDGLTALCCGNPLALIGLPDRYEDYVRAIDARLAERGVRRIVSGCPNCHNALLRGQKLGFIDPSIEMCALPQLLVEMGVRIPETRAVEPEARTFSVHDSCSDRHDGTFGTAVRALLPPGSCREMRHHGPDSICCGSGGIVSYYDVTVCEGRRARRMAEFRECGADCLVTACTSCANSMLRSDAQAPARHYLELLFGIEIDWAALRSASAGLASCGDYVFSREGDNEPILPSRQSSERGAI